MHREAQLGIVSIPGPAASRAADRRHGDVPRGRVLLHRATGRGARSVSARPVRHPRQVRAVPCGTVGAFGNTERDAVRRGALRLGQVEPFQGLQNPLSNVPLKMSWKK